MSVTKAEARLSVRQKLSRLTDREFRSIRIVEHVRDLLSGGYRLCGGFQPLPNEPDIRSLYGLEPDRQWVFPRIQGENLEFLLPLGPLSQNKWGIEEPDPRWAKRVELHELECVVVPGLAFDRSGHRLGRGKGYYDRALAQYKGLKIGVCFSEQFLKSRLVVEPHDIVMDWIVTEKFVYKAI